MYFVENLDKSEQLKIIFWLSCTVKPVLSAHSKIDKTNDYRLMQVKSIAECSKGEHSAILLICIKRLSVLKINFFFLGGGGVVA